MKKIIKSQSDLSKDALLQDISTLIDEIKSLYRDYGTDVEECMEDSDTCEDNMDEDLYSILHNVIQISQIIEENS